MSAICSAHYTTFARLHRAGPAELPELRAFVGSFDRDPLGTDWPAVLLDPSYAVFLAFEGAALSGAIVGYCDPAKVTADLCWIGVDPSARRRGIGRLLLEHLADAMRDRGAVDLALAGDDPAVSALILAAGGHLRGNRARITIYRDLQAAMRGYRHG